MPVGLGLGFFLRRVGGGARVFGSGARCMQVFADGCVYL